MMHPVQAGRDRRQLGVPHGFKSRVIQIRVAARAVDLHFAGLALRAALELDDGGALLPGRRGRVTPLAVYGDLRLQGIELAQARVAAGRFLVVTHGLLVVPGALGTGLVQVPEVRRRDAVAAGRGLAVPVVGAAVFVPVPALEVGDAELPFHATVAGEFVEEIPGAVDVGGLLAVGGVQVALGSAALMGGLHAARATREHHAGDHNCDRGISVCGHGDTSHALLYPRRPSAVRTLRSWEKSVRPWAMGFRWPMNQKSLRRRTACIYLI